MHGLSSHFMVWVMMSVEYNSRLLKNGIRVVRGPDWNSAKLDGGEGNLGTVIYIPNQTSSSNTVLVIWDTGRERKHKAGQTKDGSVTHELRIFDNAPSGIKHESVVCSTCQSRPLAGIRWQCAVCKDVDMCNLCYMNDKHDITHSFIRMDTPYSNLVYVGPRKSSAKLDVKGIFPGASVEVFSHWKGTRRDVAQGKPGKVASVVDWGQYSRGAVHVNWSSVRGDEETCRVGAEGKVDVITSRPVKGGSYYPEHLPVLDIHKPYDEKYVIGDKVRITIDRETFQKFQDGHGGWADGMEQCIEEIGTVTELQSDSSSDGCTGVPHTLTLSYQDGYSWMVNRAIVQKLHSFAPNDLVEIIHSEREARNLQKGHGGWIKDMTKALGQFGRVISVDTYGDLQIVSEGNTWVFSPVCCTPAALVDNSTQPVGNIPPVVVNAVERRQSKGAMSGLDTGDGFGKFFTQVIQAMLGGDDKTAKLKELVESACSGDNRQIESLLRDEPNLVNQKYEGKTALQAACYKCHVECVASLLSDGARPDLSITDESGDTALHYAALSKSSGLVNMLLDVDDSIINAVNDSGRTALHISVSKGDTSSVECMLLAGCDVNIQDMDGDTALHDAIEKEDEDIIDMILKREDIDLTLENKRGFNILHWATLKNSIYATNVIIILNPSLLKTMTADGFTVLHIAAMNNHFELLHIFVSQMMASVDIVDGDGCTALHFAAMKRNKNCLEVLLDAGANVNKQNKNGNTVLHLSLADTVDPSESQRNCVEAPTVSPNKQFTPIICLLLEAGADLGIKNNLGQMPLDLVSDDFKHMFQSFSKMAKSRIVVKPSSPKKSAKPVTAENMLIPLTWQPMASDARYLEVELMPSTNDQSEYCQVRNHFMKTLPQVNIVKISRIQNTICWQSYLLQKCNMEKILGVGCAHEVNVFHGTVPDAVEGICINNFDFRGAGQRVGTLYGKGTYFARDAKLADGYASHDKNRHKFVFRASVLAGRMAAGKNSYVKPPPLDPRNPNILYDSCVDKISDPKIYVIFQVNQFYPEYLIEYC